MGTLLPKIGAIKLFNSNWVDTMNFKKN
jgi:hypothetical protein